ncbi:MAG: hypothetical protein HY829_04485, partial [Actinobacteria bacterium]|nr:hypothetical protein [Actinomycetota bacterium]
MVTTAILPEHTPLSVLSVSRPADGKERARRTDDIVADLRLVESETVGSHLIDDLIETNVGVARSMASRYRNRGIDLDDLEQVA